MSRRTTEPDGHLREACGDLARHYRAYHLMYHGHGIPPSIRLNPNLKPPKP